MMIAAIVHSVCLCEKVIYASTHGIVASLKMSNRFLVDLSNVDISPFVDINPLRIIVFEWHIVFSIWRTDVDFGGLNL